MVQCSVPAVVWTVTRAPGRRLRTSYKAPGPTPSISTCPSMTSSEVDGIHQPTWAGSPGTPSAPAVTDSADAGADTCRLGIWIDCAPTGSTAGMAGAGGTVGLAADGAADGAAVAVARAGWARAGA